jgi:hypothetical protein
MIVGDSGMYSATPAFAAGLAAAGWRVVETAYGGIGLTNPPGEIAQWTTTARKHHVHLTIVMLGSWDVAWEHKHGPVAYTAVVNHAVRAFSAAAGKVLWLSILPGGEGNDRALDRFYAAAPARYPGVVEYLDIQSVLRGPHGGYPRVVNGHVLRGRDGWHLCQDGAAAVAKLALEHLRLERTGWEAGRWRSDPRYEPGTKACKP